MLQEETMDKSWVAGPAVILPMVDLPPHTPSHNISPEVSSPKQPGYMGPDMKVLPRDVGPHGQTPTEGHSEPGGE